MAQQEFSLAHRITRVTGEIVGTELGFRDPQIVERERIQESLRRWAKAVAEAETPEGHKKKMDYWNEHLRKLRPNLTEEPPPDNVTGTDRLVQSFWGHELMAMSLVFVAGKQRFPEVLPKDLTPDFLREDASLADWQALYVMTVSSLYWAEQAKELTNQQSRLKASDIVWTFGISPDRFHIPPQEEFDRNIREYHGIYPWNEPRGYNGSDAIKSVRERLKGQPLVPPTKLHNLINRPLKLLSDYGIQSTIPAFISYEEEPRDKYVRLT